MVTLQGVYRFELGEYLIKKQWQNVMHNGAESSRPRET